MGTIPVIRVKGMSRITYTFKWDSASRHYFYEPEDQREADDIFRTQGRLYKRMFFSVLLDEPKPKAVEALKVKSDDSVKKTDKPKPVKRNKKTKSLVKMDHDPELQTLVSDKDTK